MLQKSTKTTQRRTRKGCPSAFAIKREPAIINEKRLEGRQRGRKHHSAKGKVVGLLSSVVIEHEKLASN